VETAVLVVETAVSVVETVVSATRYYVLSDGAHLDPQNITDEMANATEYLHAYVKAKGTHSTFAVGKPRKFFLSILPLIKRTEMVGCGALAERQLRPAVLSTGCCMHVVCCRLRKWSELVRKMWFLQAGMTFEALLAGSSTAMQSKLLKSCVRERACMVYCGRSTAPFASKGSLFHLALGRALFARFRS
jgi:hypothetical protein